MHVARYGGQPHRRAVLAAKERTFRGFRFNDQGWCVEHGTIDGIRLFQPECMAWRCILKMARSFVWRTVQGRVGRILRLFRCDHAPGIVGANVVGEIRERLSAVVIPRSLEE